MELDIKAIKQAFKNGFAEPSEKIIEEEIYEAAAAKDHLAKNLGDDGRHIEQIELKEDNDVLLGELKNFKSGLGIRFKAATSTFTEEEWLENRLMEDKFISFCSLELGKGMRVSRAMSRIARTPEFNYTDRVIDEIQTDYSRVLNEKSSRGSLIISTNPIDFVGMSSGQGWSTCMAPDKEHGSGTLSYAKDCFSVVAFLISSKDLDKFLSSPKEALNTPRKWRRLFFVESQDKPAILASKGYPFTGEKLSAEAASIIGRKVLKDSPVIDEWHDYKDVRKGMSIRKVDARAQAYNDVSVSNDITFFCNAEYHDLAKREHGLESVYYRFRFGRLLDCLSCGMTPALYDRGLGPCCNGTECYLCGELFAVDEGVSYVLEYGIEEDICETCASDDSRVGYCDLEEYFCDVDELISLGDAPGLMANRESIRNQEGFVCDECGEGFIESASIDMHCESCYNRM